MYAAVVGGFRGNLQEEEDEFFKPLFIGRVFHENEWKIGKVVRMGSPVKGLWIWNQAGNGERMIYFDILRYNDTHSGK